MVNPKDGSLISATVHSASAEDIEAAVKAAREAYESGPWTTFTGAQRAKCINKLADLLDANAKEIAYQESICSGRPLGMLIAEVPRSAAVWRCECNDSV